MTVPQFRIEAPRNSPTAQRVAIALGPRGSDLDWRRPRGRGTAPPVRLTVSRGDGRDLRVQDSLAMIELIEDLHPDQPLHPRDPERRACHRDLMAAGLRAHDRLEALTAATSARDLDLGHHFLRGTLQGLDAAIEPAPDDSRRGLSNLDIVLAPLLWRVLVLDVALRAHIADATPRLAARGRWLLRQPDVAAVLHEDAAQEFLAALEEAGAAIATEVNGTDWSRALGAGGREGWHPARPGIDAARRADLRRLSSGAAD